MAAKQSTGRVRQTYKFIDAHRERYCVETMCRTLEVAPNTLDADVCG